MKSKKRAMALFLSLTMILTSLGFSGNQAVYAEVSAGDFNVNTPWTMSNNIGTKYTVKNGAGAFSTGKATIGGIGVTATFVKQADRNDGASYLSDNGNNQAAYGATNDMFYGNPNPAEIPALGMNTQPSNGCGGPLGSWEKYNADGEYEVGSVTFKFDRKVTDPILDLSGLGGYVSRVGSYVSNGRMILVGLGSFNSTNLHLATEGISLENVASNSNLTVDNNVIQVKDRNTHTRAVVDNGGYNWIQFQDGYGNQYNVNSPALEPAGTGSVKLKGTFDKVTFKLYHQATPYSKFSQAKYKTHSSYFANQVGGDPANGDGINGMNVINTESVHIGGQWFNGDQNWDLFRASLRLPKPSSIGDKVWLDKNANGIQDAGEVGVAGVTVKLLDKDGNPVKDFNGNEVQDQVTDANGNYKFENLAAGEYVVQVVPNEGQSLTTKGQGTANTNSDVDPSTGKTQVITLEANSNITNVDAGIVPAKEYKLDYEFKPSDAEGTPKTLPKGVLDQLPEAKEKLADGTKVDSPKDFTPVKDEVNKGTWSFEKWDKETATIKGADEHVTGTWVFTKDPVKEYKLDYEFKPSDAEGTPDKLPQEVLDQLPKAQEKLADGTKVDSPKDFTEVKDEVNKGTWKFEAWDKDTATIKGADEHVTGTWVFTKDPAKEYKVTHEFKSGTKGKDLPKEVLALLPENQTGKVDGNTAVPTEPAQKEVTTAEGTWTFKGYDRTDATINGKDEHFVGTWEFTPKEEPKPETGSVYVKYVTEDGTVLEKESEVKVNAEVGTKYTTEQKTFDGYEFVKMDDNSAPANGEVKKGDQHVTYVYRPVEPKEYKLDYEFKPSDAEGTPKTLPEGVLKQLPEAKEKLTDGTAVPSPKDFTPVKDEVNKGTWTFEKWDKETATIKGADEHVTGTWVFTKDPAKEYKVTHEFKSGTAGKDLPEEVTKLLPADQTGKKNGEKVTPTQPEKTEVPVEGGKWVFKNYDKTDATIDKADEHFVGTWVFEEDKTPEPEKEYKVTHEFKSGTPGKDLPDEVTKLLPADQEGKKDGEKVTPTQPEKTEVPVEGGKWVFKNYDKTDATIDKANEHFVGTWVFEEDKTPEPEKEYKVTHEFKSGTPGKKLPEEVKALLPKDQTGKTDGTTVVPTEPAQKEVTTAEGTWTFKGYDRSNATIDGKDEHFVGTWEFTPKEDPKPETGSVYVKYVTEDGKELEPESGVLVNAEVGTKYTTEQKTFEGYEFVRMDENSAPANGEVQKDDQHVIYVYKPVEQKQYKVDYEFKPSTAEGTPSKLPQGVKDQLPEAKGNLADGTAVPSPKDFTPVKDEVNKGTWTFEAWDKETATINGADEHVTGTWVFTKDVEPQPEEHKVTHEFKSGTVGKDLPEEVKALLPKDQTGKTDGTTVVPTEPAQKEVTTAEGTWTFKGYDRSNATIDGKDEHFVGTWEFTPKEDPKPETGSVYVKYVTEDGKELEPESGVLVNAEVGTKYTTEQKTFEGYEFVRMDENSAPANGEVKKGDQHVTYVYKKKEVTPPVEEKGNVYVKYVTEDGEVLEAESTVKKDAPVGETYTTEQKTFDGYEFVKMDDNSAPANGEVKKDDQHVTYVYKKKEVTPPVEEKGNVYVKYVTEDGKVLEAESTVKKDAPVGESYTTEQKKFDGYEFVKMDDNSAPANGEVKKDDQHVTYVYKKTEVTPPVGEKGSVYVKYVDDKGNVLEEQSVVKKDAPVGETYTTEQKTFDGYEFVKLEDGSAPANGEVKKGDQHVTYVYKKKEVTPPVEEKGNVYVKYVTEDGKVLEKESTVKKDAPVGEAYTTEQKKFDGYEFVKMEDGSAPANGEVKKGDQHVTYVYKKKEVTPPVEEGHKVTHEFKSGTPGKKLPEEVKALLPKDQPGKVDGNTVVPTEPARKEVTTADGTWTFKGYDRTNATINGKDEHFVGTWEFTPKEEPKPETGSVYVKYVTEDGTVLEKESEVLVNEKVGTPYTTDKKTFKGYEFVKMDDNSAPANGKVKKGDQHVTYVYKKKEVTPPVEEGHKVTHEFKSGTPGKKLPEEVKALLPKDQPGKVDGNTVVPTEPAKKEVTTAEGTWTFKGYDRKDATIKGKDERFVGVWEFTPKQDPKQKTGSVYVKYVTEDGKVLEKESIVKKDAPVGEAYTTGQKKFAGYEFVKLGDGSAPANGKVKKGDQHVTYVYKAKKPTDKVITNRVVDNNNNSSTPSRTRALVKTGDGLNRSTYAAIILAVGVVLVTIGLKRRKEEA